MGNFTKKKLLESDGSLISDLEDNSKIVESDEEKEKSQDEDDVLAGYSSNNKIVQISEVPNPLESEEEEEVESLKTPVVTTITLDHRNKNKSGTLEVIK